VGKVGEAVNVAVADDVVATAGLWNDGQHLGQDRFGFSAALLMAMSGFDGTGTERLEAFRDRRLK
jgi:hypothetical protein